MGVVKEVFGKMPNGGEVFRYTIENSKGMKVCVSDFGAVLVNLFVPDKNGVMADVVTGFDTAEQYFINTNFFGATVGPSANRIADASFTIDGVKYQLAVNDGKNNLHSDVKLGYHKRLWNARMGDNCVTFSLKDEDGSMGFPGNKVITVTYTLTEENELKIHYHGTSDKKTIINMTNHTYFNLAGHNAGKIDDHILTLHAANYTDIVAGAIPTGQITPVAGTPFDFTAPKAIGKEIDADCEQLKLVNGYDHNWVIDHADGTVREFAVVQDPVSGREMTAYTDLPGVQFYAANGTNEENGKNHTKYSPRCAFCLETQYYPNTANELSFPSAVFGPDRPYDTTTIYRFS